MSKTSFNGIKGEINAYVTFLQKHGILISMTEDCKPTDNAVSERIYRQHRFDDIEHAKQHVLY